MGGFGTRPPCVLYFPFPTVAYISSVRWDPNREDDNLFNQSVFLYVTYYYIQITIHRPFIPSPRKPARLSFPSLAICTNAARSCSHIVDIHMKRNTKPPAQFQVAVYFFGFQRTLLLILFFNLLIIPNRCLLSPLELSFS